MEENKDCAGGSTGRPKCSCTVAPFLAVLIVALAFGWCGFMAGIAGLMQVNIVQEVVPNALYGRELEVLAAVVLGGARLGGGRGTITGCVLGVMFVAVTQNGLNLLGISPFAFQMIIGAAILIAISTSNISFANLVQKRAEGMK